MKKLSTDPCAACGGLGTVPANDTGAVLRAERERAGVSGKVLADAMGISDTHLYDMEKGNRGWSNEQVAAYQQALGELAVA